MLLGCSRKQPRSEKWSKNVRLRFSSSINSSFNLQILKINNIDEKKLFTWEAVCKKTWQFPRQKRLGFIALPAQYCLKRRPQRQLPSRSPSCGNHFPKNLHPFTSFPLLFSSHKSDFNIFQSPLTYMLNSPETHLEWTEGDIKGK